MGLLKESFLLTATDADILAAPSRLAAIPSNGTLTVEVGITDCDATNRGTLTVQLPNGDIPLNDVIIPYGGVVADATLNTDLEMVVVMQVSQGGHVLLQYTETGTVALCLLHVTLVF